MITIDISNFTLSVLLLWIMFGWLGRQLARVDTIIKRLYKLTPAYEDALFKKKNKSGWEPRKQDYGRY